MRIPGLETTVEKDEDLDDALRRLEEFKNKLPRLSQRQQASVKRNKGNYRKEVLVELMGGKCSVCGGEFPQPAMDFHHKNPSDKENSIATLMQSKGEDEFWGKIVPDVREKCILVCSNCHRVLHWGNGR